MGQPDITETVQRQAIAGSNWTIATHETTEIFGTEFAKRRNTRIPGSIGIGFLLADPLLSRHGEGATRSRFAG